MTYREAEDVYYGTQVCKNEEEEESAECEHFPVPSFPSASLFTMTMMKTGDEDEEDYSETGICFCHS